MGFTVATHYCGGHAVKSSLMLGNGELDCGMKKMASSCESHSTETSLTKRVCCENEYLSLEIEDDFQLSIIQSDIDLNFVFTFVYTFVELHSSDVEQNVTYGDYSPPLKDIDTQVLFQSFLI